MWVHWNALNRRHSAGCCLWHFESVSGINCCYWILISAPYCEPLSRISSDIPFIAFVYIYRTLGACVQCWLISCEQLDFVIVMKTYNQSFEICTSKWLLFISIIRNNFPVEMMCTVQLIDWNGRDAIGRDIITYRFDSNYHFLISLWRALQFSCTRYSSTFDLFDYALATHSLECRW